MPYGFGGYKGPPPAQECVLHLGGRRPSAGSSRKSVKDELLDFQVRKRPCAPVSGNQAIVRKSGSDDPLDILR